MESLHMGDNEGDRNINRDVTQYKYGYVVIVSIGDKNSSRIQPYKCVEHAQKFMHLQGKTLEAKGKNEASHLLRVFLSDQITVDNPEGMQTYRIYGARLFEKKEDKWYDTVSGELVNPSIKTYNVMVNLPGDNSSRMVHCGNLVDFYGKLSTISNCKYPYRIVRIEEVPQACQAQEPKSLQEIWNKEYGKAKVDTLYAEAKVHTTRSGYVVKESSIKDADHIIRAFVSSPVTVETEKGQVTYVVHGVTTYKKAHRPDGSVSGCDMYTMEEMQNNGYSLTVQLPNAKGYQTIQCCRVLDTYCMISHPTKTE